MSRPYRFLRQLCSIKFLSLCMRRKRTAPSLRSGPPSRLSATIDVLPAAAGSATVDPEWSKRM
eukprot:COSAG06_NODE_43_length_29826_cov_32.009621_28_plen_63_part_00